MLEIIHADMLGVGPNGEIFAIGREEGHPHGLGVGDFANFGHFAKIVVQRVGFRRVVVGDADDLRMVVLGRKLPVGLYFD